MANSTSNKKLRITLTRSLITSKHTHRETVRALGLRKMHQSVEHQDNPAIRGMIQQISYMVRVEEVES
ncbi:MAG: 50S ribosomal protein L30 [Verrucomicrobiae bacterium]|nr:50S ribosomal protein L30 [Verrucomicrobiae bacterium]